MLPDQSSMSHTPVQCMTSPNTLCPPCFLSQFHSTLYVILRPLHSLLASQLHHFPHTKSRRHPLCTNCIGLVALGEGVFVFNTGSFILFSFPSASKNNSSPSLPLPPPMPPLPPLALTLLENKGKKKPSC